MSLVAVGANCLHRKTGACPKCYWRVWNDRDALRKLLRDVDVLSARMPDGLAVRIRVAARGDRD